MAFFPSAPTKGGTFLVPSPTMCGTVLVLDVNPSDGEAEIFVFCPIDGPKRAKYVPEEPYARLTRFSYNLDREMEDKCNVL